MDVFIWEYYLSVVITIFDLSKSTVLIFPSIVFISPRSDLRVTLLFETSILRILSIKKLLVPSLSMYTVAKHIIITIPFATSIDEQSMLAQPATGSHGLISPPSSLKSCRAFLSISLEYLRYSTPFAKLLFTSSFPISFALTASSTISCA